MKRRLVRLVLRVATGSELLARLLTGTLESRVRDGRNGDYHPDADEQQANSRRRTGRRVRLALLLLVAYVAASIVRALPGLLWFLAAAWIIAAARLARRAAKTLPQPEEKAPPEGDPDAVRQLLSDLIGDRPGVHLREVLAHLQSEGHAGGWTVADLRVRLEALGIPVEKQLRLPGENPTRGVRRESVTAPSPAETGAASTAPSTAT
ncbi:hypothetical protein [Streptomyces sp. SCSIO ZS0520]|uniref:hypothetical protein n=1 Tax=Streptomyces sp. SCSIO ZS0520 TaxID=2892996 RepID=UPI0021D8AEE2|nr:hypothetical protein [Streptomyces sp. SCSIO ZS0520]